MFRSKYICLLAACMLCMSCASGSTSEKNESKKGKAKPAVIEAGAPEGYRFVTSEEFMSWARQYGSHAELSWGSCTVTIGSNEGRIKGTLTEDGSSFTSMNVYTPALEGKQKAEWMQDTLAKISGKLNTEFTEAGVLFEMAADPEFDEWEPAYTDSGGWRLQILRNGDGFSLSPADGDMVSSEFGADDAKELLNKEKGSIRPSRTVSLINRGETDGYRADLTLDHNGYLQNSDISYYGDDFEEGKAYIESYLKLILEDEALKKAENIFRDFDSIAPGSDVTESIGDIYIIVSRYADSACGLMITIKSAGDSGFEGEPSFITDADRQMLEKDPYERYGISREDISETVIMDRDGLKVTALNLVYGTVGDPSLGIRARIEREDDCDIEEAVIALNELNGTKLNNAKAYLSYEALSSKKTEQVLWLTDLETIVKKIPDITSVGSMSVNAELKDKDGSETKTEPVLLGEGGGLQPVILADTESLYVSLTGNSRAEDAGGYYRYYFETYAENRMDTPVSIESVVFVLNGYPLETLQSADLESGEGSVFTVFWTTMDYKDLDFEKLDGQTIQVYVKYTVIDTGETYTTDPVTVTQEEIIKL